MAKSESAPTSKSESLAWDLAKQSFNGHATITLSPGFPYTDRFISSSPKPISSISPYHTKALRYTDTAVYVLPFFPKDTKHSLFDNIWRVWYPARPICARPSPHGNDDWAAGQRFFGVPISVHTNEGGNSVSDSSKQDGPQNFQLRHVLSKLRDAHVLLGQRIATNQGTTIKGGLKKGPYYEGGPSKSFETCFVVVDGASLTTGTNDKGDFDVLLVMRGDQWEYSCLSLEDSECRLDNDIEGGASDGMNQWAVWRTSLQSAVRLIASIDDARRMETHAPLSDQYVKRFGEAGTEVLVGSREVRGVVQRLAASVEWF